LVTRDIVDGLFPGAPVGPFVEPAPTYNLRTRYATEFDGGNGFIMNRDAVMAALRAYVAGVRGLSDTTSA
jgi:hypothetical protein